MVDDVGFALLAANTEADMDTEHHQPSDVDKLERWLTAAEAVLSYLHSRPQQLTDFEKALALHNVSFVILIIIVVTGVCA